MEILERKENPLLERVELAFSLRHVGVPTPSRQALLEAVTRMEPGSSVDQIIVKNVNTRFGQPLTTGDAYVYGSREALLKEPKYILQRHGISTEGETEKSSQKPAPPEKKVEAPTVVASEEE